MKQQTILSITGSDGTGGAGIQADVRTISAMGGAAVSAITCLTVQNPSKGLEIHDVPTELIVSQVEAIVRSSHPRAVKVGLIRSAEAIRALRDEIIGCRHIVCDPGMLSVRGTRLMDDFAIDAFRRYLLPEATVLILQCSEVELMLGAAIQSDEDMLQAAQTFVAAGAKWVMLRGGHLTEGRLTALLYGGEGTERFFTSYNIEGWQQHGVGGAMSSAIATRLAMGDDVPTAVLRAHDYMHNQVVYSADESTQQQRPADLYDRLMSLIAQHYTTAHDVTFYAGQLSITSRYLSIVTNKVSGKSPKQIIDDYLLQEAKILLTTTRLSVQEISNKLGYSSQALFSKFYKGIEGVTPSAFRTRE